MQHSSDTYLKPRDRLTRDLRPARTSRPCCRPAPSSASAAAAPPRRTVPARTPDRLLPTAPAPSSARPLSVIRRNVGQRVGKGRFQRHRQALRPGGVRLCRRQLLPCGRHPVCEATALAGLNGGVPGGCAGRGGAAQAQRPFRLPLSRRQTGNVGERVVVPIDIPALPMDLDGGRELLCRAKKHPVGKQSATMFLLRPRRWLSRRRERAHAGSRSRLLDRCTGELRSACRE